MREEERERCAEMAEQRALEEQEREASSTAAQINALESAVKSHVLVLDELREQLEQSHEMHAIELDKVSEVYIKWSSRIDLSSCCSSPILDLT